MYREIKFKNDTIAKLLKEKESLMLKGRDHHFRSMLADALSFETDYSVAELNTLVGQVKKIEDKEQYKADQENERNKLALKVQQIQDKLIPMFHKHAELGEFEDIERVTLEQGDIVMKIIDEIELFKVHYAEKKAKEKGV